MIEKAQIAFKRMLVGIWPFKPSREGSEGNEFMETGNIFSGIKRLSRGDFSGCPVIKNQPSKAEDTGSIPGQGNKILHVTGLVDPMQKLRPNTAKNI